MKKDLPKALRAALNKRAFVLCRATYQAYQTDLEQQARAMMKLPNVGVPEVIKALELEATNVQTIAQPNAGMSR